MSAKPIVIPSPKIYHSKCTACGIPIRYPFHICTNCAKQGVHFSGIEPPKQKK